MNQVAARLDALEAVSAEISNKISALKRKDEEQTKRIDSILAQPLPKVAISTQSKPADSATPSTQSSLSLKEQIAQTERYLHNLHSSNPYTNAGKIQTANRELKDLRAQEAQREESETEQLAKARTVENAILAAKLKADAEYRNSPEGRKQALEDAHKRYQAQHGIFV